MNAKRLCLVVAVAFAFATAVSAAPKKLVLLGQGPDGHKPGTHEYLPGLQILKRLLDRVPDLEVSIVDAKGAWSEGPKVVGKADGVVLFLAEGAKWMQASPRRHAAFVKFASRKGALAGLHWAIGTRPAKNIDGFVRLLGACHGGPDRKYKVVTAKVEVQKHPITSGIRDFKIREEFYYNLKRAKPEVITPLLKVKIGGKLETVCWAWKRPDGGRSFGFSGLHFHDNWQRPEYRRLIVQGVLWTLKLPIPEKGVDVRLESKTD